MPGGEEAPGRHYSGKVLVILKRCQLTQLSQLNCGLLLALLPDLPTVQLCDNLLIKNWTVGRPGNEAKPLALQDREM